jgi:hypothetical protein
MNNVALEGYLWTIRTGLIAVDMDGWLFERTANSLTITKSAPDASKEPPKAKYRAALFKHKRALFNNTYQS